MIKTLVITDKRGGYGAMKPMLRAMRDDPDFSLMICCTGQHMDPLFGHTFSEVRDDFPDHHTAAYFPESPLILDQGWDLAIIYGDRLEILSWAMELTARNIPIAHLQGGDVTGGIDHRIRGAITKLSHLHFVSTPTAKARLLVQGEYADAIYIVGDSHIDAIIEADYMKPEAVKQALQLKGIEPIVILLQHPDTENPEFIRSADIEQTIEALRRFDFEFQVVAIYPCNDPGHTNVIDILNDNVPQQPLWRLQKNLPTPLFLGLMNIADFIIGNSSTGIIEAPYFRLPAINIGGRQKGRLRTSNVIDVEPRAHAIESAIDKAMKDEDFQEKLPLFSHLYGHGNTGKKIIEILREINLDDIDMRKEP